MKEQNNLRDKAITVLELTKGFTPEQRKGMGNLLTTMEELAGDVMIQSEQIKKLEGLLNDVLADVQYADHKIDKDLRNEIKAALNL